MQLPHPSRFQPAFINERLLKVADWFLDEWHATEDDLVRDTDSPYTRGTTRFGRQRQCILNEHLNGIHDWLGVENSANDLVFSIGGVPCRFSNDDASAPTKRAVLEMHRFQMPLLEIAEPGEAVRFCFVIDRIDDDETKPSVSLLGFASTNDLVCQWRSDSSVRTLVDVKQAAPPAIVLPKPTVVPKRRNAGDEAETAQGA